MKYEADEVGRDAPDRVSGGDYLYNTACVSIHIPLSLEYTRVNLHTQGTENTNDVFTLGLTCRVEKGL